MVRIVVAIEREIDDARSIQDASASGKRKEDQPSSSSGKRQRIYIPRVSQGQGRGYQDQGQTRTSSKSWKLICCFCHQAGHVWWDYPQRQGS